jgi:hypothetical protein
MTRPGRERKDLYTVSTSVPSTLVDVGMVVKLRYGEDRQRSQPFRSGFAEPDSATVERTLIFGIVLALKPSVRDSHKRPYDSVLVSPS